MMKDIEIFITIFTGSKNIDFSRRDRIKNIDFRSRILIFYFYFFMIILWSRRRRFFSFLSFFEKKNFLQIPQIKKLKIHSKFSFRKFTAFKTPKTASNYLLRLEVILSSREFPTLEGDRF